MKKSFIYLVLHYIILLTFGIKQTQNFEVLNTKYIYLAYWELATCLKKKLKAYN